MIILIEDNRDEQEIILAALGKAHPGMPVESFSSGEEALEFLQQNPAARAEVHRPKVILLDLKMPLVDGFEVLKRLRSDSRTATHPVVVFTSSREPRDVEASYRLGANGYVCKPVGFLKMVDLMRTLVAYWFGVNEPAP
ncbi:MAG TPA: response regulator [Burkholderiales bacterium]|nr:response regulator [Burkholderiales bacterium]